jgi:hypothetical protein
MFGEATRSNAHEVQKMEYFFITLDCISREMSVVWIISIHKAKGKIRKFSSMYFCKLGHNKQFVSRSSAALTKA